MEYFSCLLLAADKWKNQSMVEWHRKHARQSNSKGQKEKKWIMQNRNWWSSKPKLSKTVESRSWQNCLLNVLTGRFCADLFLLLEALQISWLFLAKFSREALKVSGERALQMEHWNSLSERPIVRENTS